MSDPEWRKGWQRHEEWSYDTVYDQGMDRVTPGHGQLQLCQECDKPAETVDEDGVCPDCQDAPED